MWVLVATLKRCLNRGVGSKVHRRTLYITMECVYSFVTSSPSLRTCREVYGMVVVWYHSPRRRSVRCVSLSLVCVPGMCPWCEWVCVVLACPSCHHRLVRGGRRGAVRRGASPPSCAPLMPRLLRAERCFLLGRKHPTLSWHTHCFERPWRVLPPTLF